MVECIVYMKKMLQEVEVVFECSFGWVVGFVFDICECFLVVKVLFSDVVEKVESVVDWVCVFSVQLLDVVEQVDQLIYVINEVMEQIIRSDGLVCDVVGKVFQFSEVVNELCDVVVQIGNFIEIINGLVEQINLLVFNVIIEVVCVGEVGRGFVVVVFEVKVLVVQINKFVSEIFECVLFIQG